MIKEWLEHLVTPCPKWARKMGYVCDLLNVRGRQKRCRDTWRSHLEKSQGVIRAAVKECAKRRKAVILGSGWLFDVPLDALADKFRQVMLVDVVHPLQSLKTARQYPNVRAVRADLTGIGNACFEAAWRPEEKLPRTHPILFCDDSEIDLVVSLNLLSHLPQLPVKYLSAKGVHSPVSVGTFAHDLVAAHLDYLQRLPGIVAIVTDFERLTLDPDGKILERASTLRGVNFPWKGEEWDWNSAPRPEADPVNSFQRRVVGVTNIKTASRRK